MCYAFCSIMLDSLLSEIKLKADKDKAQLLGRFFKTGKGEYGEGDKFLGIIVPVQRQLAKKYKDLPLTDIERLLKSGIHEHRLIALFILIYHYRTNPSQAIDLYLKNLKYVNNWDLVDSSAPYLLGEWLFDKDKKILYKLAKSKDLWEKRIAVLSSFAFIKKGQFTDALSIAQMFLKDPHDLIHKAVGWMLREIGKRNLSLEKEFLNEHRDHMPRVMLRYAVERFPQAEQREYL